MGGFETRPYGSGLVLVRVIEPDYDYAHEHEKKRWCVSLLQFNTGCRYMIRIPVGSGYPWRKGYAIPFPDARPKASPV